MPQEPRDFAQWTKSVERRLQQALRAGQSPQAVRLARDLQQVRDEVKDIEVGSTPEPAAPVELVTQTRVLPDLTGTPRGEVSVSFAPVTVDVNANPIDVDRYELWLKDLKEEAETDGAENQPEDDSWRTNLVDDTETESWNHATTPRSKQLADLEEGRDFVAGDKIRFSVMVEVAGLPAQEGVDELMHSVRLSAFRKVYEGDPMPWDVEEDATGEADPVDETRGYEVVEHVDWQIQHLPYSLEGDTAKRSMETYVLEAEIPEGTTRITAHYAGTFLDGYVEFLEPIAVNLSEPNPEAMASQAAKMVSTSLEPQLTYSPLEVGGRYEVRVRAVALGRPGPLSSPRQVTVEPDRTPPPIPSALELSSSGATVTASWDLLAGTGGPMPVDFSHTEVAYGYLPPPTEVIGTITNLFSQAIFETPPQPSDEDFDGTWYARHRAVDTSGNKSPWSATSSIVPKSLVDEAALRFELEEFNRERIEPLESNINAEVKKAQDAISDFRTEWDENWDPEAITELERRQGTLESDLSTGLSEANQAISSFREEWDENWDPEAISGLVERADSLEVNLQQGLANAEQSYRSLAITGPRNVVADQDFETFSDDDYRTWRDPTGAWEIVELAWSQRPMLRLNADYVGSGNHHVTYGGNGPDNCVLPCVPGEAFKLRFQVVSYYGWSSSDDYVVQFRWASADGTGISWTTGNWGDVGNQGWLEMEATAPEGAERFYVRWRKVGEAQASRGFGTVSIRSMTTGDLTVDGTMLARHVDMEDFTASDGFIENAFVHLIQGKMANFDEALIGGNLLKDRSITTRHLTVADATDFAPDPIDYAAAWDFINARVTANTSSFEGAAIALDNTSTSDSQARGPILPVHPGDEIYVGAHVGWQGSSPRGGTLYLRMEWFEDAESSRETFTNVASTTSAGFWLEGTATVPDYATHARFYIYVTSNSDNPGTIRIRSSKVRVKTGGELVVDGSLKARHADMVDFTADQGFIDNAFVNLIQGKMANFDQALIGGTLLKNNSVATRHMVIGNTDELWNDAWWEDLLDNTYIFSPGGVAGAAVFGRNFQSENPPGLGGSSFDWRYTTLQGDRGIQTWPVNSSLNQRAAFRLGPGKGIPVRPGEKYTFRARYRDTNGSGFFNIDMALFDVDTGDPVPAEDTPRFSALGIVHSGSQEAIWTFEIPNNFPRMYMVPSINSQNNSVSGARTVLRPQLFRAMDGKLIVDGLLQATTGVLDELFFDTAVGNSIAAGAGRFLTIETGNLASNAVTADKISFGSLNGALITGLQIQTHTNNRGVKITSAGIRAFNSSGTEVFTVNASNGNVSARGGTFTGSSFDGGTFTGGAFQTSSNWTSAGGVRISADSRGHFRSINSAGQVTARLGGDRNELAHLSVSSLAVDGELRVGGNGEGGIVPVGDRTRFVGRTPATTGPEDTTAYGRTGRIDFWPYERPRIHVTYESPTPGSTARVPICGVHQTSNQFDMDGSPITYNTGRRRSSGFSAKIAIGGGWDVKLGIWVYYQAFWGDPPDSASSVEVG